MNQTITLAATLATTLTKGFQALRSFIRASTPDMQFLANLSAIITLILVIMGQLQEEKGILRRAFEYIW